MNSENIYVQLTHEPTILISEACCLMLETDLDTHASENLEKSGIIQEEVQTTNRSKK